MNKRTRVLPIHNFRQEVREDGKHFISGYAARFDVLSDYIAPGVREKLAPGAFHDALATSDPTANINHDDQYLLGRVSAGTLTLLEDELGLFFECEVPDTSYARDLAVLMKRGDVTKNSFAFTVNPEDVEVQRISETESIETVKRVRELFDVAIVTSRPAYPQTFSAYRALADAWLDGSLTLNELREASFAFRTNPEGAAEGRTSDVVDVQAKAEAHKREALIALEIARLDLAAIEVNLNA